jgi:putative DNA primase/helicase
VLQKIGARRLGKLLRPFAGELDDFPMPPPDEPSDNQYFHTLAAALANGSHIPWSVRKVLLTLEQAAAPESDRRLEEAIQRRIPNVCLPPNFALDRALEVWIVAPEELAAFAPPEEEETTGLQDNGTTGPLAASEPAASFDRLARLSGVEYDQARKAEAKRLNLRLRTLDEAVEHERSLQDDAEADHICLPQPEPWAETIADAPALFDQIHERYLLYLYLPPGAAVVLTLWPGHAHAINAFTHTPRLNLTSAEPGCGKSTVFDVLAQLCPKVLHTNNLKPAVLYRAMDRGQLTVLLDELDTYLHVHPELNGLLNASNKPGTYVHRCEGKAVRAFKIYAAIGLAGLGHLTPTLRHRSIVIHLREAPAGVLKARFIPEQADTEKMLGRQLARWARDNFKAIAACNPVMPAAAYNRLGDNWRPLFAIAQIIGGHWPERLLEAFEQLSAPPDSSASSVSPDTSSPSLSQARVLELLTDIREVFRQGGAQRLFSSALLDGLRAMPGRGWSGGEGEPPLNEARLARYLSRLGVAPRRIRIGDRQSRGYEAADFADRSLP